MSEWPDIILIFLSGGVIDITESDGRPCIPRSSDCCRLEGMGAVRQVVGLIDRENRAGTVL